MAGVIAALAELPERSRRALHMHRFEDKTYREIGRALGISESLAHRIVGEAVAYCMRRMMDGNP
jgi:RNA polymerase sigma-70 factor (ECF subfamily)